MKEHYYDKLLNIQTREEQKGFNKDLHYHRYEPTPYHALETLFSRYELKSSDYLVDFGCGKGRLNFYIYYAIQASAIGVEMNETFYQEALKNQKGYQRKYRNSIDKIKFLCCLAEEYPIQSFDNRFYFFNPFSLQIFMKVINNILISVENSEREIELILYYPSEEYIFYLQNHTSFKLKEEITLPHYYERNQNERFLIYYL
ncbi:MAG TPA: class I SAM-dependent methyltransferase [Pseudoneobacillus sp.]|nr:class I SAM-dependent methyltransferase [Pseudoneobacillus sp.]